MKAFFEIRIANKQRQNNHQQTYQLINQHFVHPKFGGIFFIRAHLILL
jgi:hypothetical protein